METARTSVKSGVPTDDYVGPQNKRVEWLSKRLRRSMASDTEFVPVHLAMGGKKSIDPTNCIQHSRGDRLQMTEGFNKGLPLCR